MSPRIEGAGTLDYVCPFAQTYRTASATHQVREGVLVHVATDQGQLGLGEAAPLANRTETLETTHRALREATDHLEEANPSLETAGADIDGIVPSNAPAARFGLELALADVEAKHGSQRLADLLAERFPGSPDPVDPVDQVPVNATIPDTDVDTTRELAEQAHAEGFEVVKLKGGRESFGRDLARLDALVEAAPDARVRLDINGAWSTLAEAKPRLEQLASYPLEYVEQPLPPGEVAQMAKLRSRTEVPLAADEPVVDLPSARAVVLAGACDVLVVKPMVLGGLDRALEVVALAQREAVDAVVTTTIDAAPARAGSLHLAAAIAEGNLSPRAHGLATGWLLEDEPARFEEHIVEGRMRVPEGPGHGAWRQSGRTDVARPEEA